MDFFVPAIPTHGTSAQLLLLLLLLLLLRQPALLYSRPDSSSAASTPASHTLSQREFPSVMAPLPPKYFRPQYLCQRPLFCLPPPRKVGPGDLKSCVAGGRPAECGIDGSGRWREQHCQCPAPLPALTNPPPTCKRAKINQLRISLNPRSCENLPEKILFCLSDHPRHVLLPSCESHPCLSTASIDQSHISFTLSSTFYCSILNSFFLSIF